MSNMVGKDSIGCHHIAVQDAISSKIADHQFVVEESMKDISLEEMFPKMHQNDFAEKEVINVNGLLENMVEISQDDRMTRHFWRLLKNQQPSLVTIMLYHFLLRKRTW